MLRFTLLLFTLVNLLNHSWAADRTASDIPNLVLQNATGEWVTLDNEKAKIYIERFLHIVIAEMDRSKIPASIKMAQGILESGSGMSDLARQAHNHFGIKCGGGWKGKSFYMWDDDVVKSCFRVFNRDEESYIAHTEFIANPHKLSRYGFLFKLEKTDYKGWANGLQKAGYATSKTYARALISIIERYELYKLDYLTFESFVVTKGELDSIFKLPKIELPEQPLDTMVYELHYVLIPDPFGNLKDSVKMILTKSMFKENELLTVYVQPYDELDDIAYRYNTTIKKLRKLNEISQDYALKTGQFIYLQEKNSHYKGKEVFHIVRAGQTMYDIAQHYGLKMSALIKLNKVYKDRFPLAGTKIRLNRDEKAKKKN